MSNFRTPLEKKEVLIGTGRRVVMAAAASVAGVALASRSRSAQATTVQSAFVNILDNGADPTGQKDSSFAILLSAAKLPASGGTVYCPSGHYLLNSPITISNKPIQFVGDGSVATVLVMGHTGTAISFSSTASYASLFPFSVRSLSIQGPLSGSPATAAIMATFPISIAFTNPPMAVAETGYQYCLIDDVSVGYAGLASGANISNGLILANIWKSQISNIRMQGSLGTEVFISLQSTGGAGAIDNKFINCSCSNVGIGFSVSGTTIQGVHLLSPSINAATCFTSNTGSGLTIEGLYILDGEFNANVIAADIANIDPSGAFIANTHFLCSNPAAATVVAVTNCAAVKMRNCQISGPYAGGSSPGGGVWGLTCTGGGLHSIEGIQFQGLKNGLQFVKTAINLALGLQLVDQNNFPHLQSGPAAVDNSGVSGSGSSNAQWMNDVGQLVRLR